jgi:polyhydroxyalkanoate synthesis regulator phasin
MASKRRPGPQQVSDAVREAVERTVQATVGSAQLTRERAQEAVDEVVRSAEASASSVRERLVEALEDRRPVTYQDLEPLKKDVRAILRRLDEIEKRLPAKRASGGAKKRS